MKWIGQKAHQNIAPIYRGNVVMARLHKLALAGLFVIGATAAQADSWAHRTDLEIAAIIPEVGVVAWSYKPPRLGAARIDLYRQGLVVTPDKEGSHQEKTIYLDPLKGWAIKPFSGGKPIASSNPKFASPMFLANGWVMQRLNGGNGSELRFSSKGKPVWSLNFAALGDVQVAGEMVLARDEQMLSAYRAGESSPAWTLDFAGLGDASNIRNPTVDMKVVGDTLFLRRHATLYALDPQTGNEQWHMDMAKELNLKRSDFSPEMVYSNQFVLAGNTLMLIFDSRIVAFDLTTHKVRWQMETDSFPSTPTFLVNKDTLFMLAGCQRKLVLPDNSGR